MRPNVSVAVLAVLGFVLICADVDGKSVNPKKLNKIENETKQFQSIRKRFRHGRLDTGFVPLPKHVRLSDFIQQLQFTQRLDHFDHQRTETWTQQYWVNDEVYQPGGPMFVFIGGEGPGSAGWMSPDGSDWAKNGKIYGAMLFQLEHRYYGESIPVSTCDIDNLQWLSSEQALADLANFITSMKQQYKMQDAKVVVFGGSYAGNLAAWFRLKYPHVAHGAIASSAPVLAKADFYEYLEVCKNSTEYWYPGCSSLIRQAMQTIDDIISNGTYRDLLADMICSPIPQMTDPDYRADLFEGLYGGWQSTVQYNSGTAVTDMCKQLADESTGQTLLERFFQVSTQGQCVDVHWQKEVQQMQTEGCGTNGERQWVYQTCSEFGYYQTTDGKRQPFGHRVSVGHEEKIDCTDVFNITAKQIQTAINETNRIYGARQLTATNIVLVNGDMDPWHALGITHNISASVKAFIVHGGSHCMDMGTDTPVEVPDLVPVRAAITKEIGKWLA